MNCTLRLVFWPGPSGATASTKTQPFLPPAALVSIAVLGGTWTASTVLAVLVPTLRHRHRHRHRGVSIPPVQGHVPSNPMRFPPFPWMDGGRHLVPATPPSVLAPGSVSSRYRPRTGVFAPSPATAQAPARTARSIASLVPLLPLCPGRLSACLVHALLLLASLNILLFPSSPPKVFSQHLIVVQALAVLPSLRLQAIPLPVALPTSCSVHKITGWRSLRPVFTVCSTSCSSPDFSPQPPPSFVEMRAAPARHEARFWAAQSL